MEKHTIDAKDKKLGRLASEIASILAGKKNPAFQRNVSLPISVEVLNASKINLTLKKKEETFFANYSGYPGGLTMEKMSNLIDRKGIREVLLKAVRGMLPANKLRPERLKRLTINE